MFEKMGDKKSQMLSVYRKATSGMAIFYVDHKDMAVRTFASDLYDECVSTVVDYNYDNFCAIITESFSPVDREAFYRNFSEEVLRHQKIGKDIKLNFRAKGLHFLDNSVKKYVDYVATLKRCVISGDDYSILTITDESEYTKREKEYRQIILDYMWRMENAKTMLAQLAIDTFTDVIYIDLKDEKGNMSRLFGTQSGQVREAKMSVPWNEYLRLLSESEHRESDEEESETLFDRFNLDKIREYKTNKVYEFHGCFHFHPVEMRICDEIYWYTLKLRIDIVSVQYSDGGTTVAKRRKRACFAMTNDTASVKKDAASKAKENRNTRILEALSENYRSAFYINIEKGTAIVLRVSDESIEREYGKLHQENIPFYANIRKYAEKMVLEGNRKEFLETLDVDNIRKMLKNEQSFSFDYQAYFHGVPTYYRAKISRAGIGEGCNEIVVGFANVDNELKAKKDNEIRLKELLGKERQLKEAIFNDSVAFMMINLSRNLFEIGNSRDDLFGVIGKDRVKMGNTMSYSDFCKEFNNDMVINDESHINDFIEKTDIGYLLARYEEGNTTQEMQYWVNTISGEKMCLRQVIYMTVDAATGDICGMCVLKDVTEQVEAEDERLRQLQIIQALSSNYDSVIAFNRHIGNIRFIRMSENLTNMKNEYSENISYYTFSKVYTERLVYEEDKNEFIKSLLIENVVSKIRLQGYFIHKYRVIQDNEIIWMHMKAVNLDEKIDNIVIGFTNIDDEVREDERRKAELEKLVDEAQAASKSKSIFLSNMSHDIRTPMNAILGFAQLAQDYVDDKSRLTDSLDKIQSAGDHLLALIDDVLDMSRIESGKMKIDEKENSLSDVLHEICDMTKNGMDKKNIEFDVFSKSISNEYVLCDKRRVKQIIINLVSNATKYTDQNGKVRMSIEQLPGDGKEKCTYLLKVEDNGIGMSSDFVEHIFEPFEREESNNAIAKTQGTGLGMAITKKLVDLMGGSIKVDSKRNVGTSVKLVLSFKPGKKEEMYTFEKLLSGKKALLVGNTETISESKSFLSILGIESDCADTAQEIADVTGSAKKSGKHYDLVLFDWYGENERNISLCKKLRDSVDEDTVILAAICKEWSSFEKESIEAGLTAFIDKPLFESNLKKKLLELFGFEKTEEKDKNERIAVDFAGGRVLIVEDVEMNREIISGMLEPTGIECEFATNGIEAVERMKDMTKPGFDIILMDVQMPRMNGYDATRNIRALKDRERASTKIYAMTANALEEDKRIAGEVGMDGYIMKPVDRKLVYDTIDKVLNGGRACK